MDGCIIRATEKLIRGKGIIMEKRIIIHDYRTFYRIAINTPEGTILGSVIDAQNVLQACAIIDGYLLLWKGYIEIHPRCVETWNELRLERILWMKERGL
jgi:hypothetical protein